MVYRGLRDRAMSSAVTELRWPLTGASICMAQTIKKDPNI